jgi:hypothetical protein
MRAAAARHQRIPRVDASEDPVHLEDEAIPIQGLKGWCRGEEIPQ